MLKKQSFESFQKKAYVAPEIQSLLLHPQAVLCLSNQTETYNSPDDWEEGNISWF